MSIDRNKFRIRHEIVGYGVDDEVRHIFPVTTSEILNLAKQLAAVPDDDPDVAFCYPLSQQNVERIIGGRAQHCDWFLESVGFTEKELDQVM